jgi:hypothetical protein
LSANAGFNIIIPLYYPKCQPLLSLTLHCEDG